ncbi:unnamed protein product [Boreogadus saida]
MAHGHDMKGEVDEGLSFLGTTETDWQVSRGCKSTGGMLDTVDACSLLYRLQMEGEDKSVRPRYRLLTRDRRRELVQATLPHTVDHVTVFNDVHFLMASLGAKEVRRLPAPAGRAPRPGPPLPMWVCVSVHEMCSDTLTAAPLPQRSTR